MPCTLIVLLIAKIILLLMFYILKLAKSMTSLLCCRPSINDIKSEDRNDNSECLPIILADAQKWYHRFILDHIVMLPANMYNQFEKGLCIVSPSCRILSG